MQVAPSDPLVGRGALYFDQNRELRWQGEVIARVEPGHYLIQFYRLLDGAEVGQKILPVSELLDWDFYDTFHAAVEVAQDYLNGQARWRIEVASDQP